MKVYTIHYGKVPSTKYYNKSMLIDKFFSISVCEYTSILICLYIHMLSDKCNGILYYSINFQILKMKREASLFHVSLSSESFNIES